jgi:hypothetical protein
VTKPPGEWLDETGRFDPRESCRAMTGALEIAIVVWRDAEALSRAAAADPHGPFAREATRRATWCDRQTHLVIRSGAQDLARFIDEERGVLADYRSAIGGADPLRIVAVWLIAVSVFQQQQGRCGYARIAVIGAGAR